MQTGTRIEVVKNPYAPMLDIPVGTRGVVTRGGPAIVSVKLDNGVKAKCWLLVDGHGDRTLKIAN